MLCIDSNVMLILNIFQLPSIHMNIFNTLLQAPCSQREKVSIKDTANTKNSQDNSQNFLTP